MRMRHGMSALAMACAAWSAPALADSRGQATMGNLRFTLFDLDLSDAVTPSLVWSIPDAASGIVAPGSLAVGYSVDDPWVSDSYLDAGLVQGAGPARRSFSPGPQASVESALVHSDPLGQLLSVSMQIASGGQRDAFTTGEVYGDRLGFTLSPNTRVSFTVDLAFTAGTQATGDYDELVTAFGAIDLTLHAPLGTASSDAASLQAGTRQGSPLELDQTISLSVDLSNARSVDAYGDVSLQLFSQARSWPVSAVPEPSAYAMLAAGLALFGWRRMRRLCTTTIPSAIGTGRAARRRC